MFVLMQIWILEMFPVSERFFRKDNEYPRAFRWKKLLRTLHMKDLLEFIRFPNVFFLPFFQVVFFYRSFQVSSVLSKPDMICF